LIKLINDTHQFKNSSVLFLLSEIRRTTNNINANLYDRYKNLYGNSYDSFVFNVESSRFLLNEEIYKFLSETEKQAKIISDYFYNNLQNYQTDDSINNAEFNEAFKYFSNLSLEEVAKKFYPYLRFEENIINYFCASLCKKNAVKPILYH
jgi:hypothetical protein